MQKRAGSWWRLSGMLVLVALGLPACSRANPVTDVVVTVTETRYTPATLEVPAGETVRLTLQNTGLQEHQVGIQEIALMTRGDGMGNMAGMDGMSDDMAGMDELQLHIVAGAGAQTTLAFTPTKPDQYEFFCPLPGHSERGTLIVKGGR